MKYLYNNGLVIGRFQSFHKGHEFLIRHALKLCKKVYIFIGSAQEFSTKTNPFRYELRRDMIISTFAKEVKTGRLIIKGLVDMGYGNTTAWGTYVLEKVKQIFEVEIDLYITGCEKERSSWFTNEIAPHMDELRLTRHNIEVSATDCRQLLKNKNFRKWSLMVPSQVHKYYDELVQIIRSVND